MQHLFRAKGLTYVYDISQGTNQNTAAIILNYDQLSWTFVSVVFPLGSFYLVLWELALSVIGFTLFSTHVLKMLLLAIFF